MVKAHIPASYAQPKTRCKKKGHYSAQCFSKDITEITSRDKRKDYDDYDTSYLTAVTEGSASTSWNATVTVNGRDFSFKLDTGAEVTVISEQAFQVLDKTELQSSTKRLCGPDKRSLDVLGEISASLAYKDRNCAHPVYVVKNLQQSLLGLPAIQSLALLAPVDTVETDIPEQYPGLFTGLGTFPKSYKIKMKPDDQPAGEIYSQHRRNFPAPQRAVELQKRLDLGPSSRGGIR